MISENSNRFINAKQTKFMRKMFWKMATCIAIVLFSFSVYSCGDDDDDPVGSRDLLIGTWSGIYYSEQVWENGKLTGDHKEDFVNGTNRYSVEFKEDGTYVGKDVYTPTGSTHTDRGTWKYSGNKLTIVDTEEEVWTVTKMSDNELLYEQRGKEKEDGVTYEFLEQHAFKR